MGHWIGVLRFLRANFPDRCLFKNVLDFVKGKGNSSRTVPGIKHCFQGFAFSMLWGFLIEQTLSHSIVMFLLTKVARRLWRIVWPTKQSAPEWSLHQMDTWVRTLMGPHAFSGLCSSLLVGMSISGFKFFDFNVTLFSSHSFKMTHHPPPSGWARKKGWIALTRPRWQCMGLMCLTSWTESARVCQVQFFFILNNFSSVVDNVSRQCWVEKGCLAF